ncbi:SPOC domain-like protein [Dacryopinax primogenitus]|uniref:ATP-dependent DNA helicase II subunit 2 n=1 Tax=Dacryopinax primogenitus (strain DJM 731) TaxID=1858805 RepID=M5FSJ4_DACPD|nr:SPOC domain-like protein [Dacryopinax primogenitus]EJT98868.1 SPOC domain-like protein [Dacryopinax primogenitus]
MPPRERAGYTSNIFVIDVSPSMGEPMFPAEDSGSPEEGYGLTKLEWALEYVIRKIQEFIFTERKTEECGVILFGTDTTNNKVNDEHDGYENIVELVPLSAPTTKIIDMLRTVKPEGTIAEPLDALIVAIQTQSLHLGNKKAWKRRITLVTYGETECNFDDWDRTASKLGELEIKTSIIGVGFDDEEDGFVEEGKSKVKQVNEEFWHKFISHLPEGLGMVGNISLAIASLSSPQLKSTQSTLASTWMRLGDRETAEAAGSEGFLEIPIKVAKATSAAKPLSMKKLHKRGGRGAWHAVGLQTDYVVYEGGEEEEESKPKAEGEDEEMRGEEDEERTEPENERQEVPVEKEELVKAYKYGATWVPCEEGEFEKLQTTKGMEVIGFVPESKWHREQALGEVSYVYPSDTSAKAQIQFSAIVQVMAEKGVMMTVRYVWRDGADPKVGVCKAQPLGSVEWGGVDCLLFVQMPFADDVRKYKFNSLTDLFDKKTGERIKEHSTLPTQEQQSAMDDFVDAMDLMDATQDEEGNTAPWFDPALSFNPALHRIKQALFHGARVADPEKNPLPPPHPELVKYFTTPENVLDRAKPAIERLKKAMNIKKGKFSVPPKAAVSKRRNGATADAPEYLYESVEDILGATTGTGDSNSLLAKTSPKGKGKDTNNAQLPTPSPSVAPEPGRLISLRTPLKDFEGLLEAGDLVSKAVEDMSAVLLQVATDSQRSEEMLECMKAMRDKAKEEDEVDAYQQFMIDLKKEATRKDFSNPDLWPLIRRQGVKISWITVKEAEGYGSQSSVNDKESRKFIEE